VPGAPDSLSSRDYQVLWYSWHCRFMTLKQYHRLFWRSQSEGAARSGLTKLCNWGLVVRHTFPVGEDRTLYFSTRAGNLALIHAGILNPSCERDCPGRPHHITWSLDHDLRVTDIRIAFEETGAIPITWISDHQLRRHRGRNTGPSIRVVDGMFEWEAQGQRHKGVLEFERARYNWKSWPDIARRMRYTHRDRTVFLVVLTDRRIKAVKEAIRHSKVYSDKPENLYTSDLPSVAAQGLQGGFTDLEGRSFTNFDP
jgi:hypothetical protein